MATIYTDEVTFGSIVISAAFSPDGTTLATGLGNGYIGLWDVETGDNLAMLPGHSDWVDQVVFSPDGTALASAAAYDEWGTIQVWDVAAGEDSLTLDPHGAGGETYRHVSIHSLTWSPDGSSIAFYSTEGRVAGTIQRFDLLTGEIAELIGGHGVPSSVAYAPDGATLASALGSEIEIWDVATGERKALLSGGHSGRVSSVAYSPDGSALASGAYPSDIKIWDVPTATSSAPLPLEAVRQPMRFLAYVLDGSTLLSYIGERLHLWDASTGEMVETIDDSRAGWSMLRSEAAVSSDGNLVAWSSVWGSIKVWDLSEGTVSSLPDRHG